MKPLFPDNAPAPPPAEPDVPTWRKPPEDWPHRELYDRVIDALYALPPLYSTSLNIVGVPATDLHTLNSALGASIEQSVVDNLNSLRKIWDPEDNYELYAFVRQPQTFPDVRLQSGAPGADPKILMGLELKGWFTLSKEGEPSFRYRATPGACAPADLLVVFPWVLSEVVSGRPRLLTPFVTGARHAAEHRNYYWQHLRGAVGENAAIRPASVQMPYPTKGAKVSDEAVRDSGGNFGRVARGGIMQEFVRELMEVPLAGIPIGAWVSFVQMFTESRTNETVRRQMQRLEAEYRAVGGNEARFAALRESILTILHGTDPAA